MQQQQQHYSISNPCLTSANLNKQHQYDEIILKERRLNQQIQWINQLKESYEWKDHKHREYRWLQRRKKERQQELDYELEEFLSDQLENEAIKQIDYVEEIDEAETGKRQDALVKDMEHFQYLEQCDHQAQLTFLEWCEQKQQQTMEIDSDELVLGNASSESVREKGIPIFHRKQTKINQLDLATNKIFKLIEKYGTPFYVFLCPSTMEDNYDDKDEEEEDEEDNDFNDYDETEEEKEWIAIITDDDDNFLKHHHHQQKQQQGQQIITSDPRCMQTTSFELQPQEQRPFIFIEKHRYIQPIRRELKRKNYLLLEVYHGNTLYLCERNEMEQKVSEHMARTNAYVLKTDCSSDITSLRFFVRSNLHTMRRRVTTLLDNLNRSNSLNMIQIEQMSVRESKVQMDYLIFQPDISQQDIHFRPIITCDLGSTINISRHLQRLLQPIYDQAAKSFTFFRGVDAIDAMEFYVQKGNLQSETLLVNIHIHDLCTIFPHEQTIEALEKFLHIYLPEQEIQGITIETILQLVRVVLKNQIFLYNNCLYQQIKGNCSGSPLTVLLADIFMFYWQQDLVNSLMIKNELFGRCLDEIFMTWNESVDELLTLLNTTTDLQHLPSSAFTISIDKNISYLDVDIGHIDGYLQTKVNHNLRIEPYSLPYIYNPLLANDDNVLTLANIVREALIRATRCCSKIVDFEREENFIHWSLDLNHNRTLHKFSDIRSVIHRFFHEFDNQEFYFDRNNYATLRCKVRRYDQNRNTHQIARRQHEQNLETWYFVYPFKRNTLQQLRLEFKNLWLRCCNYENESILNQYNIKFISRPNYPSKTK